MKGKTLGKIECNLCCPRAFPLHRQSQGGTFFVKTEHCACDVFVRREEAWGDYWGRFRRQWLIEYESCQPRVSIWTCLYRGGITVSSWVELLLRVKTHDSFGDFLILVTLPFTFSPVVIIFLAFVKNLSLPSSSSTNESKPVIPDFTSKSICIRHARMDFSFGYYSNFGV